MRPIPILMYHSVSEQADERYSRWCVSPERFEQQLSVLANGGYQVLTVSELVNRMGSGSPLPEHCVALTFDDGLRDFITDAAPILKRFGFPATLYVVAGRVGETSDWLSDLGEGQRPMLDRDELRQLVEQGIEIGGHSMTHPELDILSPHEAQYEISASKTELEKMIGQPVRTFAYPHGYASQRTRSLARGAGYDSAVRVCHALSMPQENLFGLSRLIITEEYDEARLLGLLQGNGVSVAPAQKRFVAVCWRLVRRLRKWKSRLLAGYSGAVALD